MSKNYIWGKVAGKWMLLKQIDDTFWIQKRTCCSPSQVAYFNLKPGMKWRHKHDKAVIQVLHTGHILYAQDMKEIQNINGSLKHILYVFYKPLFDPQDYINKN